MTITQTELFDVCSVQVEGQVKRGVRITCGHCGTTGVTAINTLKGAADENVFEKYVLTKFEKLGWKPGKRVSQHKCPKCFTAIKIAAIRKSKAMPPPKLVSPPLTVTPEVRTMTRDERRIIFEKINEVYVGEKVGYSDSWSDDKVAKDLGVPRAWVSTIREDMFGPDVNESTSKLAADMVVLSAEVQLLVQKLMEIEKQFLNLRK